MTLWGGAAVAHGLFLAVAGPRRRTSMARRRQAAVLGVGYALFFGWLSSLDAAWIQLTMPGAALVLGYWGPKLLFDAPDLRLEQTLLAQDTRVFVWLGIAGRLERAPMWALNVIEAGYTAAYVIVGGGALVAAWVPSITSAEYWNLVLPAELACYAMLPWLRARPPRAAEPAGPIERRRPFFRAVNERILGAVSVDACTIPSGHVAGVVAAALVFMPVAPGLGVVGMAAAVWVAAATVLGRYHYLIDAVTGIALAAAMAVGLALLSG